MKKTYPSSEGKQSVTEEKVIDVKRFGFLLNVVSSSCVGGIFSTGLLVTSSVLGWASVSCWWWTVQFTICRAFPSHWNKWKLSTYWENILYFPFFLNTLGVMGREFFLAIPCLAMCKISKNATKDPSRLNFKKIPIIQNTSQNTYYPSQPSISGSKYCKIWMKIKALIVSLLLLEIFFHL